MRTAKSIWSQYVNRLFGAPPATATRRKAGRRQRALGRGFEPLEDRRLMSISAGIDPHEHDGSQEPLGPLSSHGQSETHQINGIPFQFTWDSAPAEATDTSPPLEVTGGSVSPLSSIPVLHSNPGASASLFLDFDGHFEPVWGSYTNVTTPAYDIDGDELTFSDHELANIQATWQAVVEDYAPFNIDVTTVQPAVLAPGVPIANANGIALRVAIGGTSDWYATGPGLGGVSYISSFTNSVANTAYMFAANKDYPVGTGAIVSHEAGHAFGLLHQEAAYTDSWQAIMYAVGGVREFSTWANGTNEQGLLQDDMAILAGTTNGFGYRGDDRGNTTQTATPLTKTGNTWSGTGIVGTNADIDMFSFSLTTNDTYRITVNGDSVSPNLDAVLELRNSAGQLLVSANPQDTLNAEIRRGLNPGNYFLAVKSSGTYGWIGQYSVSIDAPPAGITVTPASGAMTTGEDGRQTSFAIALQTQPTADVTIPVGSSNPAEGTMSAANLVFTSANWDIPQTVMITGVDDALVDGDAAYSVILGAATSVDAEYNGLDSVDVAVVNVDNDEAGFVYYADFGAGTISRSRLGGTQPETLVDLKALFGATGTYAPARIAVDLAGGKMYWTEQGTQKAIRRANLDGSNVETLVSFPTATLKGIALDVAAGKMYWTDTTARKIQRANLDGTLIEDLVTGSYINNIALDTAAGKMYWTELASDGSLLQLIRRANLDGANSEVVWTGVRDGAGPSGIALDLGAGKMYWADTGEDLIRRANLDGTNVEVVVNCATIANGSQAFGVALDIPAGKLYWTDTSQRNMYRANLDGSLIADLEVGGQPNGLAVVHPGPEISVTHRTGLVTKENGGSDVFRVTLTTQPTANVTVALSSSDTTEGTLSTSSLTFTPANWNVTQTVTVNGVNDTAIDGDIAYSIVVAAAVSSDPNYQGLNPADVSLVNLDDDATKFYVVDDATQNRTYEYNAGGGLVESYNLNSGNTTPRGAASTIAGDKTWVVDANRKVYVYNTSGGLLGSWTAGTLPNNATVEGIATNGSDVWIVDAKGDKVYLYAGAATRLSGSQNAASSFSLNSGNSSPKDIVTDGTSLWVVNDSSTDKVFKYTVAGSFLGSWTISTSGASSPTGITIDPANVSNIWIVDSGSDKVYQYTGAAGLISGSQAAAVTFALATGNTNPQGIADPPPGLGEPLTPTFGKQFDGETTSDGKRPSPDARDAIFAALAANDLSGTGDEWWFQDRRGYDQSRSSSRIHDDGTVDFDPDPLSTYNLTTPGIYRNGFRLRLRQV